MKTYGSNNPLRIYVLQRFECIFILYIRAGEPEPLEKKPGAGAVKKLAGSSALQEDKKHKEIIL